MTPTHTKKVTTFVGILLVVAGIYLTYPQAVKAQALPPQSAPRVATPQWTPFELNPMIFSSPQEAENALNSSDPLMRRSGLEWLGRATETDGSFSNGPAYTRTIVDWMRQHPELISILTRDVKEMPDVFSLQAARLLMLIGSSAESSIPTICAALVEQGSQDDFKRHERMDVLVHLCGGPSTAAPRLTALMQDPEPETRRAAAGAAGLCDDIGFNHIGPLPYEAYVLSPAQSPVENIKFRALVLPALTSCIDDPVTAVRLAALKSLEALTYNSADACLISWQEAFNSSWQKKFDTLWQNTLPPLTRAVASPDPAVRLAALKVLAYMPGDVTPLASSLRSELHESKEEKNYALAALDHVARTDRTLTANLFLADMSSPNLAKRRQAAADVRLVIMPLWNGGFFPDQEPLPRWWDDDRLFARYGDPSLTPKQKDEEMKQKQAAQEQTQQRLLAALLQAVSDQDTEVRHSAVSSLELIGQSAAAASSHGFLFAPKDKSALTVKQALVQSAVSLQPTDPANAKRFQDLSTGLWERTGVVF